MATSQTNPVTNMSDVVKIPKEQLLVKLLKMTSSSNDGEALTAMRKANELLKTAGWDWDKLFAGKIKVVADPFANLGTPPNNPAVTRTQAPAPPPRPAPKRPTYPLGHEVNRYVGFCYCCGIEVIATAGFLFNPAEHCDGANFKRVPVCSTCVTSAPVYSYAASPIRNKRKASVGDLA